MSSDDQFTSIQWDREDLAKDQVDTTTKVDPITEESNSQPNSEGKASDTIESRIAGDVETDDQNVAPETEADNIHESNGDDPSASLLISSGIGGHSNQESNQKGDNHESQHEATGGELGAGKQSGNEEASITGSKPVDTTLFDKYKIEVSATHPSRDLDASSKPFISYLVTTTTDNPNILKLIKEKK